MKLRKLKDIQITLDEQLADKKDKKKKKKREKREKEYEESLALEGGGDEDDEYGDQIDEF